MDSDQKYWLIIWLAVIVAIASVVIGAQRYETRKNELKVDMVRAGASPVEAACALDGDYTVCLVKAGERR